MTKKTEKKARKIPPREIIEQNTQLYGEFNLLDAVNDMRKMPSALRRFLEYMHLTTFYKRGVLDDVSKYPSKSPDRWLVRIDDAFGDAFWWSETKSFGKDFGSHWDRVDKAWRRYLKICRMGIAISDGESE